MQMHSRKKITKQERIVTDTHRVYFTSMSIPLLHSGQARDF